MTLDFSGRSSISGLSSSSDFSLRRTGLGGGANGVDTLACGECAVSDKLALTLKDRLVQTDLQS